MIMFAEDEEDPSTLPLRDQLQLWCDENKEYALGQRIALVPEEILKKVNRKPKSVVLAILDKEGY
jgi:hypothetical protein